ncbi:caspase-1-like [Perognathus longimembris pacificus]|uniref:caspase-1-like n=1 Tax=Perognathus longimembris pacificus TaxID=214514 RepID=UPI002019CF51|nr:caspase-1-like [Perognathus longimembris pacificus]
MADKFLKEKRKQFIRSVGTGTINGLLDELLEKRVLNQEEMEKVKFENATVMDKARALADSVIRKGPQACQICVDYICEEDCHLAETLGFSSGPQIGIYANMQDSPDFTSDPQQVHSSQTMLTPCDLGGSLKLCSLEMAQRMQKAKGAEIYPIMNKLTRKRLALIICNIEFDSLPKRAGADADIKGMETLLEQLGYSVIVKRNLMASEMITEMKAFANRLEHQTSDSTFVVFMSHGIREGICGRKYPDQVSDVLKVDTIFQMLNTANCPSLKDKPKVIIIQACRGENKGVVWLKDAAEDAGDQLSTDSEDFEDDGIKRAHIEKDFIAFCSSTPDNISWRHPVNGSLFIMKLIKTMQEFACSCDLEEIFRKVRFSFELPNSKAQMPTTERVTLTRCFYLFPGH